MSEDTIVIQGEPFQKYLRNDRIEKRIEELGHKISEDYQGLCPIFVIVLNGAFMFASSLLKHVTVLCKTDFIRISSYTSKQSTGKVLEVLGLSENLEGKDLIVVEDIVDTGLSMHFLLGELAKKNPSSVQVASLFYKPEAIQIEMELRYVGFEIENRFVVGYGLDYDGVGRNYPDLYVVAENLVE
jgi:hypoxanthine phosphoribosyltransferase